MARSIREIIINSAKKSSILPLNSPLGTPEINSTPNLDILKLKNFYKKNKNCVDYQVFKIVKKIPFRIKMNSFFRKKMFLFKNKVKKNQLLKK